MSKRVVLLTPSQQIAAISIYHSLVWDIRHNSRTSPSTKYISELFGQRFKNKPEAFMFIHDLFKYNDMDTIDICDMGDCPGLANRKIPNRSIGKFKMSWEDFGDKIKTDMVRLCQICHEDMLKLNVIHDIKESV